MAGPDTDTIAMTEPLRVLIVEDNNDHARLAVEVLQTGGLFATEVAFSIGEMWNRLAARSYDVALLDYYLPDGTGLQALQEIPARGYRLPVIMVTGRGDERVAAQAIQSGAIDYLVKRGDYLVTLPALVKKAVRTYRLMLSAQRSLEQIRYQAMLLDNVRDAVVVWDVEGRITFWNRVAESLFGRSAAEQLGKPASTYQSAFDPPLELPTEEAAGSDLVMERRVSGRSQEPVWISSHVTVLYDESGQRMGAMDVSRNITARKRLEARIRAAQAHLTQSARLSAIGELASGVAHQISNPLTAVIGEAQILLGQLPAGHPARESAEAIERAGWRAQAVVGRLLEFSQPASATLESISINEAVEHALALVRTYIETAGVSLHIDLAANLPTVKGNARQLEDLWVNLLLFERSALADGHPHSIRLCTERGPQESVRVQLSDDGPPVPPERLASIFDPDFLEPVDGPGAGLALSISHEIVRQHNGQISAESAPNRGTTFTVILPTEAKQ